LRTGLLGEGENLAVDPPRRLVQSMVALWGDDVKSEGTTRVTWEIEPRKLAPDGAVELVQLDLDVDADG